MNSAQSTRLSVLEEHALRAYVQAASNVPKVAFIFAEKQPDLHVYVGLQRRSLRSCEQLFEIQDAIREDFPGFQSDFHIIYTDGRQLEDFASSASDLVVDWRRDKKRPTDPVFVPEKIYRNVPKPIRAPSYGPPVTPQPRSRSEVENRHA